MPRSSRSSGASRSAPAGSRGAHTMAAPHQQQQQHYQQPPQAYAQQPPMAAQQQSRGPGLFGQMASTAAGVAVGSTVGHGLSNMLFGGSSSAPAEQAQQPPQAYNQGAYPGQQQTVGASCEQQSKDFIKCLESSTFPPPLHTLLHLSNQHRTWNTDKTSSIFPLFYSNSKRHELLLVLPRAAQSLPGCRSSLLSPVPSHVIPLSSLFEHHF